MSGARGPLAVRILVTTVVLGFLVSRIELGGAVRVVARIDGSMWALLVAVVAADRLLAAGRWVVLVRVSGIDLPVAAGARLFFVSSFLGSFLPAGVGGDVARTWELANRTSRIAEALAVAVVDRWLGLACVLLLGVIGTMLATDVEVDSRAAAALRALLGAVLLAGLAGPLANRLAAVVLPARRVSESVVRLAGAVRRFWRRGPAVGVVVGLSFAMQTLRIVLAWLIGVGLAMDVPLAYYFVVMPIGIVLILLPISIGGFGPAQGLIIWMLRPAGVPDEVSFAMSTLYLLLGLAANIPGAILFLDSFRR